MQSTAKKLYFSFGFSKENISSFDESVPHYPQDQEVEKNMQETWSFKKNKEPHRTLCLL